MNTLLFAPYVYVASTEKSVITKIGSPCDLETSDSSISLWVVFNTPFTFLVTLEVIYGIH